MASALGPRCYDILYICGKPLSTSIDHGIKWRGVLGQLVLTPYGFVTSVFRILAEL